MDYFFSFFNDYLLILGQASEINPELFEQLIGKLLSGGNVVIIIITTIITCILTIYKLSGNKPKSTIPEETTSAIPDALSNQINSLMCASEKFRESIMEDVKDLKTELADKEKIIEGLKDEILALKVKLNEASFKEKMDSHEKKELQTTIDNLQKKLTDLYTKQ